MPRTRRTLRVGDIVIRDCELVKLIRRTSSGHFRGYRWIPGRGWNEPHVTFVPRTAERATVKQVLQIRAMRPITTHPPYKEVPWASGRYALIFIPGANWGVAYGSTDAQGRQCWVSGLGQHLVVDTRAVSLPDQCLDCWSCGGSHAPNCPNDPFRILMLDTVDPDEPLYEDGSPG